MSCHPLALNARPFVELGQQLRNPHQVETHLEAPIQRQYRENSWFTPLFCRRALEQISATLEERVLLDFCQHYSDDPSCWNRRKLVALIGRGGYPFSDFRMLLYILLSGNDVICRQRPDEQLLTPALVQWLIEIDPTLEDRIHFVERLSEYDAVIAECSSEQLPTFQRYFQPIPHLLYPPQYTAAVLSGEEETWQLTALAEDIYLYFGRAPRSVGKLYAPLHYDFVPLLRQLNEQSQCIAQHHHYLNHLDYQKASQLMCHKFYMDAGTFLFLEEESPVHEPAIVHYSYYEKRPTLRTEELLASVHDGVQFGNANAPRLSEYPYNIDPMLFLSSL